MNLRIIFSLQFQPKIDSSQVKTKTQLQDIANTIKYY